MPSGPPRIVEVGDRSSTDADGSPLACVTIDGSDPRLPAGMTHLRWFIVDERARGQGLGDKLMRKAMGFVETRGALGCYLVTWDLPNPV